MRIIDADALKKAIANQYNLNDPPTLYWWTNIEKIIDNAPELGYEDGILSIETATRRSIELEEAYNNGWSDGFSEGENERPKGKWITKNLERPYARCNICGEICEMDNFCGNCGADMRKGE